MLRKERYANIPIELLRSFSVISEEGSFSKAARVLGLTQSAISAQIKRLQIFSGGAVFERTLGGLTLTDRGKLVLKHAKSLLEINDRILGLAGSLSEPDSLRVGLPTIYARRLLEMDNANAVLKRHSVYCDVSEEISRGMNEGYVDVGCFIGSPPPLLVCKEQWRMPLNWVQAPGFIASPLSPVPIVGWHGLISDRIAFATLEQESVPYTLMFASPDSELRRSAVRAGLGFGVMSGHAVPAGIVVAHNSFLPELPAAEAGIYTRLVSDSERQTEIVDFLRQIVPKKGDAAELIQLKSIS